jgi:hypothetical protein
MKVLRTFMVAALPLALAAGCTTLQGEDKAMLEKASADASAARTQSQQAADAANRAATAAQQAAAAAERAANEAKASSDRVNAMFQRNLRKR